MVLKPGDFSHNTRRVLTYNMSRTFSVFLLICSYSLFLAYTNIWVPENGCTVLYLVVIKFTLKKITLLIITLQFNIELNVYSLQEQVKI